MCWRRLLWKVNNSKPHIYTIFAFTLVLMLFEHASQSALKTSCLPQTLHISFSSFIYLFIAYLKILPTGTHYTVSNCIMTGEKWTGNDGSGYGLLMLLSQNLPGGTEEKNKNLSHINSSQSWYQNLKPQKMQ
jgi:hypothetical protein